MTIVASLVEEVQEKIREALHVLPRGGGTKPALSTPLEGVETLDMTGISGMLEYEPGEYTFTALAGTRILEINSLLSENSQYLPFDPPLVERGATLGGSVAAGLSGPGRYHYGGVRDFLLGVRYINSEGQLVSGGAKVVKNAAGFDLPKLMVGSLGSLGVLIELTFKVFPRPETYATLRLACTDLDQALKAMQRVVSVNLDLDALDLETLQPRGARGLSYRLWVRLGGLEKALPGRLERLRKALGKCQVLQGADEERFWRDSREMAWIPEGWTLVKAPMTPGRIPAMEIALSGKPVLRRYSCGGQVAWLASLEPPKNLESLLSSQGLTGLVLWGPPGAPRLGESPSKSFYLRIKNALDPLHRFPDYIQAPESAPVVEV